MNHYLPPYIVGKSGDVSTLSETTPEFLTRRGDYQLLKELTGNGEGIRVGVGDTGFDRAHVSSDLINVVAEKDFTRSRNGPNDVEGHGSHVGCHIGADDTNQKGISGIASKCELVNAKMLGDSGSGSVQGIADGILWMIEQKCDIINLSLGGGFSRAIDDACKEARDAGVLVFAALGNDGGRSDSHPGTSPYTIGVAAVDYNLRLANFSSRSDQAILCGYGVNVLSCINGGRFAEFSGTSMATPDQAGIAALLVGYMKKAGRPIVSNRDYFDLIKPSLKDLGPAGWDRGYGHGFLDVWDVLNRFPIPDATDPTPEPDVPTHPCVPKVERFKLASQNLQSAQQEYENAKFDILG